MTDRSTKHGWARITPDLYEKLVAAYRQTPGIHANAARRALCTRETAKRGFELGWPRLGYRPIRHVLEEEAEQARARAREAAEKAQAQADAIREKARAEAIDAQDQERQMLRVARGDVLAALVVAAELAPTMRVIGKAVAEACKPGPDGSPPQIAPALAMQLLTRHATLLQKAVGAAEAVITLSRLDRGASTANVAIGGPELTLESAIDELEALDETLTAARARGPRLLGRGGGASAPADAAPAEDP